MSFSELLRKADSYKQITSTNPLLETGQAVTPISVQELLALRRSQGSSDTTDGTDFANLVAEIKKQLEGEEKTEIESGVKISPDAIAVKSKPNNNNEVTLITPKKQLVVKVVKQHTPQEREELARKLAAEQQSQQQTGNSTQQAMTADKYHRQAVQTTTPPAVAESYDCASSMDNLFSLLQPFISAEMADPNELANIATAPTRALVTANGPSQTPSITNEPPVNVNVTINMPLEAGAIPQKVLADPVGSDIKPVQKKYEPSEELDLEELAQMSFMGVAKKLL